MCIRDRTRGPGSETAVHLFMRHPHGDSKIWQEDFMTDFKSPFFLFVLLPIISSKIDYIESPLRVSYRLKRDHPLIIKALQYFLKSYGFAPDMASELVTMPDKRTLITEIVKADPRQFKESKTFLAFCEKLDALGRRQSFELESPHSK
jgi:hypothetical protein